MLVAHFHFGGRCDEAIRVYEKAFGTTVDFIDRNEMGVEDFSIQMVPIFKTKEQLLQCYEIIKDEAVFASLPEKTFFSPLIANVVDKFGIRWGLMVGE